MVPRVSEHLANNARTLSNVLVDDSRGHDLQEVGVQGRRNGARKQCLASSRGAIQQYTLWRRDANAQKQFRIKKRELDDLKPV